jgi:hypothetical protein
MYANAWTPAQVGRVLGCGELQVTKYLTGYRRLSAIQSSYLRREFGPSAEQLIDACNAAFVRQDTPSIVKREGPKVLASGAANAPDSDWDGALYTISEWRRRFGVPGSSQGQHGRVEGFYPSEPCFIGE